MEEVSEKQSRPLFSIVMPVFLGEYKNSATQKTEKFLRAIYSVTNQSFKLWELIIISDGCQKSIDTVLENKILDDDRISMYSIEKQKIWSGTPRNVGIDQSSGLYIIYLDADDVYENNYLEQLKDCIGDEDWFFVNDIIFQNNKKEKRICSLKKGVCGTSNIIHKKDMDVFWNKVDDYAHDWNFIQKINKKSDKYKKLDVCGYVVMHIPKKYDK